jgi:hypothetical protein
MDRGRATTSQREHRRPGPAIRAVYFALALGGFCLQSAAASKADQLARMRRHTATTTRTAPDGDCERSPINFSIWLTDRWRRRRSSSPGFLRRCSESDRWRRHCRLNRSVPALAGDCLVGKRALFRSASNPPGRSPSKWGLLLTPCPRMTAPSRSLSVSRTLTPCALTSPQTSGARYCTSWKLCEYCAILVLHA